MPYPKHLLQEGETVALDLRPHWWYFSKHILTGLPLFIALVLIIGKLGGDAQRYARYLWAALAVVWAAWLGFKYLEWTFTHFVVTDKRVVFRTGVIAKHGTEIPLERINNINFHQNIVNRLIGAGDLDIESAGRDGQSHFDNVRHPDGVQQEIYRQMEVSAKRQAQWGAPAAAAAASPAPAAPAVTEQIEQLARLREAGRITAEEYEAKKTELLQRM